VGPVPSRSAIYRCLRRHGLIELRRRRRRRDEFRRWERERPMQLWQMDVMGGVLLEDGTELKVLTGVDDHSRFCVAAGLVTRATSKAVCAVLAASLNRYGIPDEILTDNGKVFTGPGGTLTRTDDRAVHRSWPNSDEIDQTPLASPCLRATIRPPAPDKFYS